MADDYRDFRTNKDPFDGTVSTRMIWMSVRLFGFAVVALTFVGALGMLWVHWQNTQLEGFALDGVAGAEGSAELSTAERLALQGYLFTQGRALDEAAGSGSQPINFIIEGGQNANIIALNLSRMGVIDPRNETLFLNYLRYYGYDSSLKPGEFVLSPQESVPEIVERLLQSSSDVVDVEIGFLEGWRIEQMVEYLEAVSPAAIDPDEFQEIVVRDVDFGQIPDGLSEALADVETFEGYLFPDDYRIPLDATAEDLVAVMLERFDERVNVNVREAFKLQDLTLHEAVTVASIVEREAVVEVERPTIASVYLNRLDIPMRLEADPTVQYALGFDEDWGNWWKSPLFLGDLEVDSPYNTYQNDGIPPAPIASPSLGSMLAVANPESSEYLFFVAGCQAVDVPAGTHLFSLDFDEHLANVVRCSGE